MPQDVRDKPFLTHEDVLALNFIRDSGRYLFRRHFRTGLRSHIMEVLELEDVRREREGIVLGGVRRFPRARPVRMLRVFRTRFQGLEDAWEEIERVKVVGGYLGPAHFAHSDEFLADYAVSGRREILLCGLQTYVAGEILDPWRHHGPGQLRQVLLRSLPGAENSQEELCRLEGILRSQVGAFVSRIKKMMEAARLIPDLAGVGNLLVTPEGEIKLVDINNISEVLPRCAIRADDRGYPVCDKSVEALSLLEGRVCEVPIDHGDPFYRIFLDPGRMKEARDMERTFHESMKKGR